MFGNRMRKLEEKVNFLLQESECRKGRHVYKIGERVHFSEHNSICFPTYKKIIECKHCHQLYRGD